MTALSKYDRLEATGLWRASPDEQRREVVVSIGDATLVISDNNDRALTHWSLAAIERQGVSSTPAVFSPEGDPGETLELQNSEAEMVKAIETLRRAILKSRPRPGRLRWIGVLSSIGAVVALGVFWLPGAVHDHTLRIVPDITRATIGNDLAHRIQRVTGAPCSTHAATPAKIALARRIGVPEVIILRDSPRPSLHLPGGKILLNRSVLEDYELPDVAAGYVLAEKLRIARHDALADVLDHAGLRASFTLLTTGELPSSALQSYAEFVLARPTPPVPDDSLLAAFEAANLRSTPYALALDITGETTVALIEADPVKQSEAAPLLSDADWLRLQAICGN